MKTIADKHSTPVHTPKLDLPASVRKGARLPEAGLERATKMDPTVLLKIRATLRQVPLR